MSVVIYVCRIKEAVELELQRREITGAVVNEWSDRKYDIQVKDMAREIMADLTLGMLTKAPKEARGGCCSRSQPVEQLCLDNVKPAYVNERIWARVVDAVGSRCFMLKREMDRNRSKP